MSQSKSEPKKSGFKEGLRDYVGVAERIEKFYERYPEGRIITHIVEHDVQSGFILIRAEAFRLPNDTVPSSTGHAYEIKTEGYVQRTSYIEVCETSAVGRALAMAGFEVRRGIASREEMEKVDRMSQREAQPKMITEDQLRLFEEALVELGFDKEATDESLGRWGLTSINNATYDQAEEILNRMERKLQAKLKQEARA